MKSIGLILILLFLILSADAQNDKKYLKVCIGFYNVENLFDTIHQPGVIDEEFTPEGLSRWNTEKYNHKLDRLSEVISQIGGKGAAVLGVSEIENEGVLIDLINTPRLRDMNYGIAHFDSPEARGVDVALLYMKQVFTLHDSKAHRMVLEGEPNFKTRDILQVSGDIDGEEFHFLVGHWPSRRGGEKASEYRRIAAAKLMKHISDSLQRINPKSKVILMGDFNDDAVNNSIKKGLEAKPDTKDLGANELFAPMYKMYKEGYGSLAYRDTWNLFDNLVVNGNLIGEDYSDFRLYRDPKTKNYAFVFNKPFLAQKEGKYKGYPWRTIVGGQYQGGYSDHFPVYLYLVKEIKQ